MDPIVLLCQNIMHVQEAGSITNSCLGESGYRVNPGIGALDEKPKFYLTKEG